MQHMYVSNTEVGEPMGGGGSRDSTPMPTNIYNGLFSLAGGGPIRGFSGRSYVDGVMDLARGEVEGEGVCEIGDIADRNVSIASSREVLRSK